MKSFSSVEAHIFIVVNKVKRVCMREWEEEGKGRSLALFSVISFFHCYLYSFLYLFIPHLLTGPKTQKPSLA